jgi:imidazolonepropionase-like amidohydrolase
MRWESYRPSSGPSLRSVVALGVLLALAPLASARAEGPDPPPYYAIRNVDVKTGNGQTLTGVTVLLADGLIEAVGAGVTVPADAWVIEGEGLTLFPGLIDALGDLGQKPKEQPSAGGMRAGPPRGGPQIRGPEDRPATTPWVNAANLLGQDSRVEKWREAGFTAAVTAPADGLFAGQAALINLADVEPRQRVIATPVAQRLNLQSAGGRSYPGSLMGVLAYAKQVLYDTQHFTRAKAQYGDSPLGRERPEYDRTLEPLERAIGQGLPFLVPASLGREIDRALTFRGEFELATVLYGGQGAYARIERLREAQTPVLVSLKWPEEAKGRDPEADTPFSTLYHRRLALTTPRALHAAGIPFAFYSDGLSSPSQVFEKLRQAIDAGLSAEAALAALTSSAAKIFGVDDRLGTIEKGKIANLVLATAEPWAEDAEVRAVFVDGRKYELRQDEEPKEPPAGDVSGTWELSLQTPRGTREMSAELTMTEDGKVTGEISSERGTSAVDEGRMSADLLSFKVTRTMGGRSMEASYSLRVAEEHLSGTLSAGPMTMDVSGERTSLPEPKGEEKEKVEVSLEELEAVRKIYHGPVRKLDSFAILHATVYTVSGATLEDATVLVGGGKILAVGPDVEIPPGVEVIDAAGGSLTPGIIDAHSHLALEGGGNEGSLAVTSMVSVRDILNPDDVGIYRALAGGVTATHTLHGSANPIGGQTVTIKLRWGADAEGLQLEGAPPGLKFALGENPKRSNFRRPGMPQRYPQSRMGVMDVIRQAFTEARQYQAEWRDYRESVAAGKRGSRRRASGSGPLPPRRDLKLEALVEVLEGKRQVHAHAYRADEILQLLRLAEELGFHITSLEHALEGYKVADEIAAHGAGAFTFSDWWGYKFEAYDAIPYAAALMTERGVRVSIKSDSDEEMRHLNQEAAKTMKWGGLDEIEALKLVTLNPAQELGIADRVGSIEVGKDADLVLFDGHPLSVRSVVQKTFVDGVLYFDRDADRARQAKIDEIKARLLGKEEPEKSGAAESEPQAPDGHWRDDATSSRREES